MAAFLYLPLWAMRRSGEDPPTSGSPSQLARRRAWAAGLFLVIAVGYFVASSGG